MKELYPWQQTQWQSCMQSLQQNRLPHALLLSGAPGLGKAQFAAQLSARVLCEQAIEEQLACGACRSCQLFLAGSHPDFYQVVLEEKAKRLKVDQIRGLMTQLANTSQRGGYQVVIIHPADKMNTAAANSLLKTLEEPSGQALLLLVCDQTSLLPATIISRCQSLVFAGNMDEIVLHWLKTQVPNDQDAHLLLRMADYAPLQVLYFVEVNALVLRDQLLRHLLNMQQSKIASIAAVSDFLKQDLHLLLRIFLSLILDVQRILLSVSSDKIIHQDRLKPLQKLSHSFSVFSVDDLLKAIQFAKNILVNGVSINPELLLENLFCQTDQLLKQEIKSC